MADQGQDQATSVGDGTVAQAGDGQVVAPPSIPPRTSARPSGAQGADAASQAPAGASASPRPVAGPRKARLAVSRVDPWSVMKFSFLMSFAVGIMIVVGAAVIWLVLDGLHVFTTINDTLVEVAGDPEKINILQWVTFDRTVSFATIIALADVVLLTILSTVFAFLYNITASLVGGVTVTLTDE